MNKRVIAVGFFDGIHKGHKALMDKAVSISKEKNIKSAVFTFKKHPDEVVFNKIVPLITTDNDRESTIKKYGNVSEVFFWDFDKTNSAIPWDTFTKDILFNRLNASHIVTGEDFKFGYKGLGNSDNLSELCKSYGIGYDAISKVLVDDTRVSSTHIRSLISSGNIENANRFLSHPYEISGTVIHGRKLGRTIGVPTINVKMPLDIARLPNGVYITLVTVDGITHKATTNIGVIPTFLDTNEVFIEANILDFAGDLYGKTVTISFFKFIRPEKKFDNIDTLKEEILKNINETRNYGGFK